MTDQITIPRALLERAMDMIPPTTVKKIALKKAIRAELAKPVDLSAEMSAVADQDDVLICGYNADGELYIRSSRLTRAEALFLATKAARWAEGVDT